MSCKRTQTLNMTLNGTANPNGAYYFMSMLTPGPSLDATLTLGPNVSGGAGTLADVDVQVNVYGIDYGDATDGGTHPVLWKMAWNDAITTNWTGVVSIPTGAAYARAYSPLYPASAVQSGVYYFTGLRGLAHRRVMLEVIARPTAPFVAALTYIDMRLAVMSHDVAAALPHRVLDPNFPLAP